MGDRLPIVRYAVKSSADEHDSVRQQLEGIAQAVARDGDGRERFEYAGPFHEQKATGYHGNRGPELEAAMAAAERAADEHGECELWVWATNRLGRGSGRKDEARSVVEVMAGLRRAGVTVRAADDDEFARNSMLWGIAGEMAHKYALDLAAAVKRGKKEQFEQGERLGGPVPQGYRLQVQRDENDTVVRRDYLTNEEERPAIERMVAIALEGLAPARVAARLNGEGYTRRSGKPWDRRSVQNILTNPFFAGGIVRYRNRHVWKKGSRIEQPPPEVNWGPFHHAYMTREQFERIQAGMQSRDRAAKARQGGGRPTPRYLLQRGLAICNRCGETMYAVTSPYKRKDGTRARQYICSNVKNSIKIGKKPACDASPINAEWVDSQLIDSLPSLMFDFEDWIGQLTTQRDREAKQARDRLTAALKRLDGITDDIGKIEEDYIKRVRKGDEPAADVASRALERLERRRRDAEEDVATRQAQVEAAGDDQAPHDAMLDAINAFRAAVRQRMDEAAPYGIRELNDRLRELFVGFKLDTPATDMDFWARPIMRLDVWEGVTGEFKENEDGTLVLDRWIKPEVEPLVTGPNDHE